jgi:hypothetical protein
VKNILDEVKDIDKKSWFLVTFTDQTLPAEWLPAVNLKLHRKNVAALRKSKKDKTWQAPPASVPMPPSFQPASISTPKSKKT